MKLNVNGTIFDVASLEEASSVWCEIRDRLNLGASEMFDGCGEVKGDNGNVVGRVSYNGRIFTKDGRLMKGTSC